MTTQPSPSAAIRYVPLHPKSCPNPTGRHMHGNDFGQWFATLTEPQKQWLRDKARWEHMSLSAVAIEWGAPTDV